MADRPDANPARAFTRAALFALAGWVAACGATDRSSVVEQQRYAAFVGEFLEWHFASDPLRATRLGIREHDGELPDLSREGIESRADALDDWLARLEGIDREALIGDAYDDYRILEYALRADLLELREVRSWERSPALYVGAISGGLSSLADRAYAPIEVQLRGVISRQARIPDVLDAARRNLTDVPALWAEQAVRSARATARFLGEDLPRALAAQGLDELGAEPRRAFRESNEAAVRELEEFADWLEEDLLPRADGDFRLGRELFERKLRYEEHVDLSADELRILNEREIERYHVWIDEVAAAIDPARTPRAIMDSITSIHPAPDELIPTAERFQEEIRAFIREHDIVSLPSDERPTVRETPDFARGGFASMNAPGPFETVATEAFYNITNVLPEWSDDRKREHLTYFNYPGLLGITIHESFPGHFVQFMFRPRLPTEVRKVFNQSSLSEGWAHYTEQMMIDEGLGAGDPAIRLGQLRRAVQRHARWYAGLEMHAFGASVEEATERFQDIAYFAHFPALQEVERGTRNPTYLYYALGRMQIFQLREDYREFLESRGEEFSLRDFHDAFLVIGLPVSLARKVMIPGDERSSIR
jgi:uncharacterized protein (DUF885 family)